MTTDKPSRNEAEYFVKQDAELLRKQRETAAAAARDAERKTHYMKCPKDGFDGPLPFNEDIVVSVLLQKNTKAFKQHRRIREASRDDDRRPNIVRRLPHSKVPSRAGTISSSGSFGWAGGNGEAT